MKDSYRFKNDVKADLMARMALKLDELVTDKWYTPVDLIMLFDKVMLHEVKSRIPPPTIIQSYSPANSSLTLGLELRPLMWVEEVATVNLSRSRWGSCLTSSIGWKNCRALSTVVTNPTTKTYGPEKNAGMFSDSNIHRNTLVPLLTANNEQIHMQFSRLVSIDQLILGVSQTIDIWLQDAT